MPSRQTLSGVLPGAPTPNAKVFPGSDTVTVQVVQYTGPRPLRFTWPRKRAPTAGPVAPSSHSAPNVSGLYEPMRVTSVTRSQTFSAGAAMWTVTDPCMARTLQQAPQLTGGGV